VLDPHVKPRKFIDSVKKKEGFKTLDSNDQRRAFASTKGEEAKVASTGTKGERLERVEKMLASLLGQMTGQSLSKPQNFISKPKNDKLNCELPSETQISKVRSENEQTMQTRMLKPYLDDKIRFLNVDLSINHNPKNTLK
jgi:hypothetical protein